MALLVEIKAHLETLTPTVGTIYRGAFPATPNSAVMIAEYGGATPDLGFGVDGIAFESPGLQINVRGEPQAYDVPRALIQRIFLALAKVQGATLSGVSYLMLHPVQSPFHKETDSDQRKVFAVNFIANKVPS